MEDQPSSQPRVAVADGVPLPQRTWAILTIALGSLGLLVWITSRYLNRDARLAHDSALRDVSVQLCLLHEDLGLLRTVRIHGLESYDTMRRKPTQRLARASRLLSRVQV